MKYLLILLFICVPIHAKTIKIAVLDSGFDFEYKNDVKLCDDGHKDLTKRGLKDETGHGNNIVGLIGDNLENIDYCLYIVKYTFPKIKEKHSIMYFVFALEHILELKPDIINISGGGLEPFSLERSLIRKILKQNIKIVAAAGNNNLNLDKNCNFYPACYDPNIIVIGNIGNNTNYGKVVDFVIDGNYKKKFGIRMSGSSQSAAIYTNKLIKELSKQYGK